MLTVSRSILALSNADGSNATRRANLSVPFDQQYDRTKIGPAPEDNAGVVAEAERSDEMFRFTGLESNLRCCPTV